MFPCSTSSTLLHLLPNTVLLSVRTDGTRLPREAQPQREHLPGASPCRSKTMFYSKETFDQLQMDGGRIQVENDKETLRDTSGARCLRSPLPVEGVTEQHVNFK